MTMPPQTPEQAAQMLCMLNVYTNPAIIATIRDRFNISDEEARRIVGEAHEGATEIREREERITDSHRQAIAAEHNI